MNKSSITASVMGFALLLATADLHAAELRVLAGGGIAPALNELKTQFERASGHTLVIVYATTPELIKEATSGAPFDFGVVPTDVMKDTNARARFAPEPTTDVARVGYGVVVRAGAPKPNLSTAEAFKQALLDAPSIAFVPESAAGAQTIRVFERLGISEAMKAKTKSQASPAQITQAVARGDAALGLFLTSALVAPGVELAGPFPEPLQQDLVYTAAVSASTKETPSAKAFIDYIQTPDGVATIRAKGMRP
jgi:molybdate transport system substrate-binding protein